MFGTNGTGPAQSATSQAQRVHLGFTVWYLSVPKNQRVHLTGFGTGHLWWWCREEASVVEKHILDEYGTVARWNGTLGVRCFVEVGSLRSCYRTGTSFMGRRPQGYPPYPAEL